MNSYPPLRQNWELRGWKSRTAPDSSNLILQWRIHTQNLELDAFCAELEAFINKVEQWRQALEDFRPAAEKAVIMDEETQLIGMPNSGFISV